MFIMLLLLLFLSPRFILLLVWLFDSLRWHAVFPNFLFPLIGFFFLPWTTLVYFFVYNPALGYLTGWDWVWIILAVLVDLGSYGSTRYKRVAA